ncbi:MAG: alkaline shock response membrane anchor protein AmaP [Syntrophomonadaceae bacterium]|jgi:uncharacterized alkaline shock family protein YloU|nr:alkaline shock response membrane anchor protein AmaP [Syntrophomonadaceae bacterium]
MKVKARLLVSLLSLLLTGLGVLAIAISLGWMVPIDQLLSVLNQTQGKWLVGLVGAVLLLLGLILFFDSFKTAPVPQGVIRELKLGRVVTTVQALESVVHRAVRQVRGVREVKPLIRVEAAGLIVVVRVVLSPEVKVPEIAEQIQQNVKTQINDTIGTEVVEVRVKVDNIGYDAAARVE